VAATAEAAWQLIASDDAAALLMPLCSEFTKLSAVGQHVETSDRTRVFRKI
jgi:hypothetical protein